MRLSIALGVTALLLAPMGAIAASCTKDCPKVPGVGGGKAALPGLKGGAGGLFKPGGGSPFGGAARGGVAPLGGARGGGGGTAPLGGARGAGGGAMVRGGGFRGGAGGGRFGHGGGAYARGGAPMRSSGRSYMFHGHRYGSFRAARFQWRHGWGYRAYGVGYAFPFAQWPSEYFISDYAFYGLDAPPPGFWWIRNGPDIVLVDSSNGLVSQTIPGAFDEDAGPGPDDQGGPPPDGGYGGPQGGDQGGPPPDQGGPGDQASGYGPPQDGGYGPPQDGGYGPPPDNGPPPPPPCHGFWCGVKATVQTAACASLPTGCPPDADQPPSGDPQDQH